MEGSRLSHRRHAARDGPRGAQPQPDCSGRRLDRCHDAATGLAGRYAPRSRDVQEAEYPADWAHREHELLRVPELRARVRHFRTRRRRAAGRGTRRPVPGPTANLPADSRRQRYGRSRHHQRAEFCCRPRVRRGGRANSGTSLHCQLYQVHDSADCRAMNIAYSKHTLANGLDVILHEDHSCPIVAVNLWYHVGSKNEEPGHTGFAHLFEHLMFEGSEHHDRGFFPPLQGAGASLNGSTNADRTNYWEVVPSNALELALWMESDRMGYLLPALTDAKFKNQRDVVLNERRQNYENRPYGLAAMATVAALYPSEHPYHWLTMGSA